MSRPQSPPVQGEHLMIAQEMWSWQAWPVVQSGLDLDKRGLSCNLQTDRKTTELWFPDYPSDDNGCEGYAGHLAGTSCNDGCVIY